ncbi:bifunctional DNA primase/helicase [Bartonella machadoae]|uniref:bifunctional DNA primase/helicase n=1 Tax=Bartonella machadoae TaxID=2893471 RepID=UPI001F4C6914|nr:bifunctional DNA primase/helicase [Bartonella machadoae]UNE53923.1 toprim domain-containing protein [Bartonella machadoae]
MSTIFEIKQKLTAQADAIVQRLLPKGKRRGNDWIVGSTRGEEGQSLSVCLSGHKAGLWYDFAEGRGGDLLDLWCEVKGISLSQALEEVRSTLNLTRPKPFMAPHRSYRRPPVPTGNTPQNLVKTYLNKERHIPLEILKRYRIGEDGEKIIFPFYKPDGTLALVKERLAQAGAKPKPTTAQCEPILFGWQALTHPTTTNPTATAAHTTATTANPTAATATTHPATAATTAHPTATNHTTAHPTAATANPTAAAAHPTATTANPTATAAHPTATTAHPTAAAANPTDATANPTATAAHPTAAAAHPIATTAHPTAATANPTATTAHPAAATANPTATTAHPAAATATPAATTANPAATATNPTATTANPAATATNPTAATANHTATAAHPAATATNPTATTAHPTATTAHPAATTANPTATTATHAATIANPTATTATHAATIANPAAAAENQAFFSTNRTIVITEGEIDALSLAAYGYPALSVPFGGGVGGKHNWIENEFDNLEPFETIFLATDMDKPGEEAAREIANRLGRHRCYRVQLPCKDANDCLTSGIDAATIKAAFLSAKSFAPEGLRRASDYKEQVIGLFWPTPEQHEGYTLPYPKLNGKLYFRPAELTLWSGASGAGKSQLLSDCIPHWISQNSRLCLASLEMKGEQSLRRLTKQTGGLEHPTREMIERILHFLDEGLILYEHVGKSSVDTLLDVFDYCRARYGCDQFIIDSLMRLGICSDDYAGQEQAVYKMVDWAVLNAVHIHLVAHARKGGLEKEVPGTEDIKGASEIGANAFNIITIWRNRSLEDKIFAASCKEEKAELAKRPGVIMNIAKQRSGDFEGKIGLWFDQKTYRYRCSCEQSITPRRYLERGVTTPLSNSQAHRTLTHLTPS